MMNKNDQLIDACKVGNLEEAKRLIENGADIHANNDLALYWAAGNGHMEVVKLLIENGANIHAYDDLALYWAAGNGHMDVVKLLLDHGANLKALNYNAKKLFEFIERMNDEQQK